MLTSMMAGGDVESSLAVERARGMLPPGSLCDPIIEDVLPDLEGLVAAASDSRPQTSAAVHVTLPGGTTVVGTVPRIRGDVIHRVTFSRMSATLRLVAWLHLLALSAMMPDRELEAVTFARGRPNSHGSSVSVARIAVLGEDASARRDVACNQLRTIVDLYFRAMREPPPLYCKTSAAWAEAASRQRPPHIAADAEWTSKFRFPREDQNDEHVLVLGGVVPFDELLRSEPRPDESGGEWDEHEASRLGRWACRLWGGLLAHEQMVDR
jgi:exodeoxyribonuclease V gamma subunit